MNPFPGANPLWIEAKQASKWLLLGLHGSLGSAEGFREVDPYLQLPNLNRLYLNGLIPDYGRYRWYIDSATRLTACQHLSHVLDWLNEHGFPTQRTFLLGFSQGAALCFELAARYPRPFAGIISMSGQVEDMPFLLKNIHALQKKSWLVTHGTHDTNLSVERMRNQVATLQKAGLSIEYFETDKGHEFDAIEELPFIRRWIQRRM